MLFAFNKTYNTMSLRLSPMINWPCLLCEDRKVISAKNFSVFAWRSTVDWPSIETGPKACGRPQARVLQL